jgi:hypothetical protein
MITIYGIWYNDVEAPGLVAMMFDGKLAQRLADESWDFIRNNPFDTDTILGELQALEGKSDDECNTVMAEHDRVTRAWRSNIPLSRYASDDYLFEMFVNDGFSVSPVVVHGAPQFNYMSLRNAVQHDAWMERQLRWNIGESHVLSEVDMHRRVSSVERVLAYLSRRR